VGIPTQPDTNYKIGCEFPYNAGWSRVYDKETNHFHIEVGNADISDQTLNFNLYHDSRDGGS
jgi:hypothetical protein